MFLQHYVDSKIRKHGIRSLHIQRAARGLSRGIRLVNQQESKSFLRQVRSPGHLLFFASNVALLLHVRSISTINKQAEMEKHLQHMNELENYEEVIKNLDAQEEAIRKQIAILKSKLTKKECQSDPVKHRQAKKAPLSERESLRQSYSSQRTAISSILSKESNIDSLFQGQNQAYYDDSSNANEELFRNRTHSSTISHSLSMLSNMFIKSALVEINLRNAFDDESFSKLYTTQNYLFCRDLFQNMKNDVAREHLYANLINLRGRNHTPSNPIWRHLDDDNLKHLRAGFQHADHFRSRESIRLDYYYHKSGKCLNYESANKSRHILAIQAPVFHSDIKSSAAYIEDFRKLFENYKADSHPMKHLNLVLGVAQRLVQDGDFVPQVSIFRELLELFGKARLYNYQSLVYDTLPGFEHVNSILASGDQPHELTKKKSHHFASIIQNEPSILESLIQYQVIKNDPDTLNLLLEYLAPRQDVSSSKCYILPAFMLSWDCNSISYNTGLQGTPLISTNVIESAIEACIEFKEYEKIDKILGKLVFDSVQVPEGIRIALNNETKNVPYLSQTTSETTARKQLFSDKVVLLLGKAYLESGDKLRCNWLASLLSDILVDSSSENLKNLHREILHFTKDGEEEPQRTAQYSPPHNSANYGGSNLNKSSIFFNMARNANADSEKNRSINVQNSAIA